MTKQIKKIKKPVWKGYTKKKLPIFMSEKKAFEWTRRTGRSISMSLKKYELDELGRHDLDRDGVPNQKDCNPYDPDRQEFFGRGYDPVRTLHGYNVEDYLYTGSGYVLKPGAKKEKKGLFERVFG